MRSAVVLAGGYSDRFGDGEKATAELDGESLVRRVTGRVGEAVDEVVVNCRRDQRGAIETALSGLEYRVAVDPVPGRGPVAGVRTGCRVAGGTWTFVTACDMPFLRPEVPGRLFEAAEADGVVPRVDGRRQPLAGVYRTERAVDAADSTLRTGSRSMRDFLDRLSIATLTDGIPARVVRDVDTRAELEAARSD